MRLPSATYRRASCDEADGVVPGVPPAAVLPERARKMTTPATTAASAAATITGISGRPGRRGPPEAGASRRSPSIAVGGSGRRTAPGHPPASHPGRRAAVAHRPVALAMAAGPVAGAADGGAHTRSPRARTLPAAAEQPRGPLATAPSTAGTAQRRGWPAPRRPGRTEFRDARDARTPGYRNQPHRP